MRSILQYEVTFAKAEKKIEEKRVTIKIKKETTKEL
jgi:hypothetical protein